jgi:hypothetical protein
MVFSFLTEKQQYHTSGTRKKYYFSQFDIPIGSGVGLPGLSE